MLAAQTRLGPYEIVAQLGAGGMGEVYRARDTRLDRDVALKILLSGVASDPARLQRFEQEARAAGALNHPNIVAVYDIGREDGVSYIVSELVEGESLRDLIQRGPVPLRKLLDLAAGAASGLAAAHAAGIVHRDLKPENIMIARDGRAKILDFGLARQITPEVLRSAESTPTQTTPGAILGTVGYMAPEQVRGLAADHRADLFSFGLILYEMLSGRRAFARDTSVETLHAILNEEPPELPAGASPALARVISHCLEKEPGQRFQSAQDLAFALLSLSGSTVGEVAAPAARPVSTVPRILWMAGAAAAAILLFAGGYLLRGRFVRIPLPVFHQVTFRHGSVDRAMFSPDGRSVVYSAAWDMRPARTFVQSIGNPEAHDLDFPDGTDVASVSMKGDLAVLRPHAGSGAGRVLARTSLAAERARDLLTGVTAADWAPDGASLAVVRRSGSKMRLEYPAGAVLFEAPFIFSPRVSPDGAHVAFCRLDGLRSVITVVDRGGKARDLATVAHNGTLSEAGLAWAPGGREIWFTAADLSTSGQIQAVDLNGRRRAIACLPGYVELLDISRDGRVLIEIANVRVGILFGGDDGAQRDLSWLAWSFLNDLSADGKHVLITESGPGTGSEMGVYLRPTDGAPAVRLSAGFGHSLSPDGKWAEVLRFNGNGQSVLVPTGAGEEKPIVVPGLEGKQYGVMHWLPGGRVLLWAGQLRGAKRLYLWNLAGGAPRGFGPAVSNKSLLSPDGRDCLIKDGGNQWALYPLDGGPPRPISALNSQDVLLAWSGDARSVFVTQNVPDRTSFDVTSVNLATGRRSPWKRIQPMEAVGQLENLTLTTGGRAFAYNYQSTLSTLYVIEGWK
ncbi:MAG: protein kinase [Bryobacteraceae bacterium]